MRSIGAYTIAIDALITTITERFRVVRRLGSVSSGQMRSSETTTAFLNFLGRRDMKTPLSFFWSDVGRTFWASASKTTGAIEAQWVSSRFGDDSRSFARESMQLTR